MNTISSRPAEMSAGTSRRVAVLGASSNPERYSHMAVVLLKKMGFPVIPIHPTLEQIEGLAVVKRLEEIPEEVHTLTLYAGPKRVIPLLEAIVQLAPRRVIFNPGTESVETIGALSRSGIECVEACTLVMLKTGQF